MHYVHSIVETIHLLLQHTRCQPAIIKRLPLLFGVLSNLQLLLLLTGKPAIAQQPTSPQQPDTHVPHGK